MAKIILIPDIKVPVSAKIHIGKTKAGKSVCPIMVVGNVHVYPGVPSALKESFRLFQVRVLW